MEAKVFQLQKRTNDRFDKIEDKFDIDAPNRVFALSDGATQSFMPAVWAQILTSDFIVDPRFEVSAFIQNLHSSLKKFESRSLSRQLNANPTISGMQKVKSHKGGSAAFIAIKIESNKVNVIGCGDSYLVKRSSGQLTFFPEGSSRNVLINTNDVRSNSENLLAIWSDTIYLEQDDDLFLLTDAVANYVVKTGQIDEIGALSDFNGFLNLITTKWDKNEMEVDDISIIHLTEIDQPNVTPHLYLPPLPETTVIKKEEPVRQDVVIPPPPEPEIKIITPSSKKNDQDKDNMNRFKPQIPSIFFTVVMFMVAIWYVNAKTSDVNHNVNNRSERDSKSIKKEVDSIRKEINDLRKKTINVAKVLDSIKKADRIIPPKPSTKALKKSKPTSNQPK